MSTIVNYTLDEPQTMKNLQWLKKGTRLERILCLGIVASLLIVAILTAVLVGYHHENNIAEMQENIVYRYESRTSFNTHQDPNQKNLSSVCLTPGCVKAASAMLSSLDEKVNPCDDFYRFACGEWIRTHQIPDDKSSISLIEEAQTTIDLQLKALLEMKLDYSVPSFIRMTREFFETCMDIKSIEKAGAEPLTNVLKRLGGWPVVEGKNWDASKFDWLEILISLRKLGYSHNSLLKVSVSADIKDSSRQIIQVDVPTLGTDRTYLVRGLDDSVTTAYYKKMVKAATLLGARKSTAEKDLLDALEFEMTLANYSLPLEEKRNISMLYNKYTVKTLQEMAPQVPWLKYIGGLLMNKIYENETLIVKDPEFIKKFAVLITSTEKRVIANYMLWRVVDDSLPLLSKEWRDIKLEYDTELTGKSGEEPRWGQCLTNLFSMPHENLEIPLSSYYIQHHFKAKTKVQVSELVKYLQKEFLHILDKSDWMDERTKAHAKAKANNMVVHIAYPEELLNNTAVMEIYHSLTLSKDSYFENVLRLSKWGTDDALSKLRKPKQKQDWKKQAAVVIYVNAFFNPVTIELTFPAGALINPFYDADRPNYLNFGALGSIIGHEITHGFDDQGRQYDKDGNNVNWWEKATDDNFRKKTQCIVDQYNNYTAESGMKLNGVNTQGENIADNGGLKESYWAYQSWVKDNGPEQLLPGLKYSQNQLFWISFASFQYCAKYRPEKLNDLIISDEHSPNPFRVLGALSNLEEFAKDFNCPPDSPMNKKKKCQVW